MCARGVLRHLKWFRKEEVQLIAEVAFETYRRPLGIVTAFKYLGRILTASVDDWVVVVANMQKGWKCWAQLSRILGR